MSITVEIRFVDEKGHLRAGELVNPHRVADRGVDVEYVGDHEIDVYVFRSNGEEHIFRTHISRVASMRPVAFA